MGRFAVGRVRVRSCNPVIVAVVPFPWCGQLVHSPVPDLRYSILVSDPVSVDPSSLAAGFVQATVRLVSPALLTVSCSGRSGAEVVGSAEAGPGPFPLGCLPLTLIWYSA